MAVGGPLGFVLLGLTIATAFAAAQNGFSYSGPTGPGSWGGLCATRKDQSPIDIVKKQVVKNNNLGPVLQNYRVGNAALVNYGHGITVVPAGDFGSLVVAGKTYSLKQFHWHTPSEHRLDGIQYAAELHLFHRSSDGSVAVVSVLYNYGNPDPFLSQVSPQLQEMSKEVCREDEESHFALSAVDPNQLRQNTRKHFQYMGSKTIPPCNETVNWIILDKIGSISTQQVSSLKAPLRSDCKNNNRPVQPLHGRQVQFYNI